MKQILLLKYKSVYNHPVWGMLLKLFISFFAVWHLTTHQYFRNLSFSFLTKDIFYLTVFAFFSIVNWYLEIKKWQKLSQIIQPKSFYQAAKESLISFSASLITPNRVGEYGAKALFYTPQKRKKIVGLNFVGNIMQLGTSLLFGLLAGAFIWFRFPHKWHKITAFLPEINFPAIWLTFFTICLISLAVFFIYKNSIRIKVFYSSFPANQILGYSILRYIVFSSQFVLIWALYHHSNINSMVYPAVFLTYLMASLIPAFSFFDWAIKGSAALFVFSSLDLPHEKIFLSIATMWLFNFFIPFLIGGILYVWPKNLIKDA